VEAEAEAGAPVEMGVAGPMDGSPYEIAIRSCWRPSEKGRDGMVLMDHGRQPYRNRKIRMGTSTALQGLILVQSLKMEVHEVG